MLMCTQCEMTVNLLRQYLHRKTGSLDIFIMKQLFHCFMKLNLMEKRQLLKTKVEF